MWDTMILITSDTEFVSFDNEYIFIFILIILKIRHTEICILNTSDIFVFYL